MGKAMAMCLLKAGHHLRVWNRSVRPAAELRDAGAVVVGSPREAFGGDAFISMLADDTAVREVVSEALTSTAGATVHIGMSTISVACARELVAEHAAKRVAYVAAPVLGRPELAAAGKLHILAAGPSAAIDHVQPLFAALGQRTWRFGDDPSQANLLKIAVNLTLACAIEAMGEAAALVGAHGIPAPLLINLLTETFFAAPAYKGYGELIAHRRYEPAGFKLRLGLKDVRLALAAGEGADVPLPFASVLRDNFIEALAHGQGSQDWSAVAEVAVRRAGMPRR